MNSYPVKDGKAYIEPLESNDEIILDNYGTQLGKRRAFQRHLEKISPVKPGDSIYVQCKTCRGTKSVNKCDQCDYWEPCDDCLYTGGIWEACPDCIDGCEYTDEFKADSDQDTQIRKQVRIKSPLTLEDTPEGWRIVAEVE